MPSLQIVSKVVGKRPKLLGENKRGATKPGKDESSCLTSHHTHPSLKVGSKVKLPLSNKSTIGTLKFIGPTKFSAGIWCGIELNKPDGRNNGTVKGVQYFQCKFSYGIFVPADKVIPVDGEGTIGKNGNSPSELPKVSPKDIRRKMLHDGLKNEESKQKLASKAIAGDNSDDHTDGFSNRELERTAKEGEEGSEATVERSEDTESEAATGDSNETDENMKTILAAEVGVENSPLKIKIASVSEDDDNNNNIIEPGKKLEFKDGLLFYVTAHQQRGLSPKDKHQSCPDLNNDPDEVFTDEGQLNTWPRSAPKDAVELHRDHIKVKPGTPNLKRTVSGIEKRIRSSQFRTPSPGGLRRSFSHGALYPKENYVAYDEERYTRSELIALKRSFSDEALCGRVRSPSGRFPKAPPLSRRPWMRREKTAPELLRSSKRSQSDESEDEDVRKRSDALFAEKVANGSGKDAKEASDIVDDLAREAADEEVSEVGVDGDDLERDIKEVTESGTDEQQSESEIPIQENASESAEEPLFEAEMIAIENSAPPQVPSLDCDDWEIIPYSDNQESTEIATTEKQRRPSINKVTGLRRPSPVSGSNGLPVFVKNLPSSKGNTAKRTPIPSKAPRKYSAPAPHAKRDISKAQENMRRISQSQMELSKNKDKKVSIDDKIKPPRKLNRRVSDMVANFEKPKENGQEKSQPDNRARVKLSVGFKPAAKETKVMPRTSPKPNESLNSKEPRKSISSVSSLRKSSQVSTEELAGKEALSRQYVQDNTKRPTSTNKAGSSGAQITPKSGIAAPSNRTGIPGYNKRQPKLHATKETKEPKVKSVEITPRKPIVSPRTTTPKNDKDQSSPDPAQLRDEQNKVRELKEKCTNCENQINELKDEFKQKNVAMEAFIVVIKQHIQTIEEQSEKQLQLRNYNKELEAQLGETENIAEFKQRKLDEIQQKLNQVSLEHANEVENLTVEHQSELDLLRSELTEEHNNEIEQVKLKLGKSIEDLKEVHSKEINDLQEKHTTVVKTLRDEYDKTMAMKDEESAKSSEEVESRYQTEQEEICLEYEDRLQDLQLQLQASEQKCDNFESKTKNLQEELAKDVESRLQGALAKYKNLPAELESLHAVIELKNEDIRKSRTHNMELQKKVEDFYELEKKYMNLLQEKESLNAALQNKVKCERQLSVERESLQANLQKEERKSKRLSMEKEELMWKFSNSSSLSLSSPSLNIDTSSPNGFQSTPNSSRSFSRSLKTQSLYLPPLDDEDFTVL